MRFPKGPEILSFSRIHHQQKQAQQAAASIPHKRGPKGYTIIPALHEGLMLLP